MKTYEKIRAYIDDLGFKQNAVAERSGIPPKTFNAIMNGKRTLYADEFEAICVALNVPAETFFKNQSA